MDAESVVGFQIHGKHIHALLAVPPHGFSISRATCLLQPINGSILFHGDYVSQLEARYLPGGMHGISEKIEIGDMNVSYASKVPQTINVNNVAVHNLKKVLSRRESSGELDWNMIISLLNKEFLEVPPHLILNVIIFYFLPSGRKESDYFKLTTMFSTLRPKYPREIRSLLNQSFSGTLIQCSNDTLCIWLASLVVNQNFSRKTKEKSKIGPVVIVDMRMDGSLNSSPGCVSVKAIESPIHLEEYREIPNNGLYFTGNATLDLALLSSFDILSRVMHEWKKDRPLSSVIVLTHAGINGTFQKVFCRSFAANSCNILSISSPNSITVDLIPGCRQYKFEIEDFFPYRGESASLKLYQEWTKQSIPVPKHFLGDCFIEVDKHRIKLRSVLNRFESSLLQYNASDFADHLMGILDVECHEVEDRAIKGLVKISATRSTGNFVRLHLNPQTTDIHKVLDLQKYIVLIYGDFLLHQ